MSSFSELVELYKSYGLSAIEAVNAAKLDQAEDRNLRIKEKEIAANERQAEADRLQKVELEKIRQESERLQTEKDKLNQFELDRKKQEDEHELKKTAVRT